MRKKSLIWNPAWAVLLLSMLGGSCSSEEQPPEVFASMDSRQVYGDRLRAMWLAECIANWTGLVTEKIRQEPPFLTDQAWGTRKGNFFINGGRIDFVFQDPWGADDDTDIEYIYLEAMAGRGRAELSAEEIREAWLRHIEPGQNVWVSNNEARKLMGAPFYTLPPSTSLLAANDQSLMIDAQLTTEIFGAVAPGMPDRALELSDLPIRVTASGYAAHAAQFYVALYALASAPRHGLTMRDRIQWMVETARRFIPDTSKTADVIDFALEDYRTNPDVEDWERTRDAVAERFQSQAAANGFKYLGYYESSVNLATGLIALLYGEGDLRRTVQIGTLSGWDSDNGTATMGGLLGLMMGTDALFAAFPDVDLSDDYDILRTRVGFEPHHCEDGSSRCFDTFTDMAQRMIPLVEREIEAAGGTVNHETGRWVLPRIDYDALSVEDNPLYGIDRVSANNRLQRLGEVPRVSWAGTSLVLSGPSGVDGSEAADGLEFDFSGTDRRLAVRETIPMFFGLPENRCYALALPGPGTEDIEVSVTWETPLTLDGIRFAEGPHTLWNQLFGWTGGFSTLTPEVRTEGGWVVVEGPPVAGGPNPSIAFEVLEWDLYPPVMATGVRVSGRLLEDARFAAIAELEGILLNEREAEVSRLAEPSRDGSRGLCGWVTSSGGGKPGFPDQGRFGFAR